MRPGLRTALIEFFRSNPEEFLTVADVMAKFDVSLQHVYDTTCLMRKHGELGTGPTIRLPGVES